MDFLTICQELRSESGISGSGPVSVSNQTGIQARLVYAVRDAWTKIQKDPKDWKWMWRDDGQQELLTGVNNYVPTTVFTKMHPKSCKIYKTSLGVSDISRISLISCEEFDRKYCVLQNPGEDRPSVMTVAPDGHIKVYPKPDDTYTITFDYQKEYQLLADNADVPEMPAEYHPLIKYEAMILFGGTDDAPELIQLGATMKQEIWRQLIWEQELRKQGQMVVVPE